MKAGVSAAPNHFDVGRCPNHHIAFGIDEHFRLGANLAGLELRVMFGQLAEWLESIELAGPFQRMLELRRRHQVYAVRLRVRQRK